MKKQYLLLSLICLLPLSCTQEQAQQEQEPVNESIDPTVVEGVAQILLDDDLTMVVEEGLTKGDFAATKSASFNEFVETLGITSMERVFPDAGEFEARHRDFGLHKWYRIVYRKDIPVTKAGEQALLIPGIKVWELVRKEKIESSFNDSYLSEQWHYINDGTGGSGWKKGADVNVEPVWEHYTTGSSNVFVAVVDGGIDLEHEDLGSQVDKDRSKNFGPGGLTIEASEHGTHVGGTIAAINNNGIGVCGIAGGDYKKGNSGVRLISCSIFTDGQKGSGSGAEAIIWAADHGAVLVNNSWGISYDDIQDNNEKISRARSDHEFFLKPNEGSYAHSLKDAVDYFNANAGMTDGVQTGPMAGGLVLFSAGNDGWEYGGYAAYPGVMAVGAIAPNGNRSSYSCYGDWVDICAPGGEYTQQMIMSTLPNNQYGYMQGTSMSCPHLTGVAALVVSYCGKDGFTRQMLWDRLVNGGKTDIVPAGRQIGPLVDALGAITYGVDNTPGKVGTVNTSIHSNYADLSWKVTGNNNVPAYGYQLIYGKDRNAVESSSPSDIKSGVTSVRKETGSLNVGANFAISLENLDFETTYYGKVYGYDYSLNYSEASSTFSFTTGTNSAPIFEPQSAVEGIIIHAFESIQLNIKISDPEGHKFTVEHTPGSTAEKWFYTSATDLYSLTINGRNGALGSYTANVKATDSFGKSSSLKIEYTIVNEKPEVVKPLQNIILDAIGEQFSIPMTEYVSDPDGETLSYTIENTAPTVVHLNPVNNVLHGVALGTGMSVISITGTDALGESVTLSFKALVRNSSSDCIAYPNPVENTLYISNTEVEPINVDVRILSSTGGFVYSGTVPCGAFDPANIDMSKCAPGVYSVTVSYNGNTYKQTVIKK